MQRSNAFRCNKRPPESKETPPGGHNQPRRSRSLSEYGRGIAAWMGGRLQRLLA